MKTLNFALDKKEYLLLLRAKNRIKVTWKRLFIVGAKLIIANCKPIQNDRRRNDI